MTTPTTILRRISDHFGVDVDTVRGTSKTATAVRARRCAVYVLRLTRGLSWGEVALVVMGSTRRKSDAAAMYRNFVRKPDADIGAVLMVARENEAGGSR